MAAGPAVPVWRGGREPGSSLSAGASSAVRDRRSIRGVIDPALGHPASRAHPWAPVAPVPIPVAVTVDTCLFAGAVLVALIAAPWWSCALLLVPAVVVLTIYGRRAARALGILSRDETPRAWLIALAIPSGVIGVLAVHTDRYATLVLAAYLVCLQIAERIVWARFLASRRLVKH